MARKPTHRREVKRLDSKKVRAAEDAALRGDHLKLVRTGGWAGREDRQPPLLDAPSTSSRRGKKKEISYCPARKHEGATKRHYYIEREVECERWYSNEKYVRKYKECMYCRNRPGWSRWWW